MFKFDLDAESDHPVSHIQILVMCTVRSRHASQTRGQGKSTPAREHTQAHAARSRTHAYLMPLLLLKHRINPEGDPGEDSDYIDGIYVCRIK